MPTHLMNTARKLKVAVIGVGHLGKEHARIYASLPNVELVAICDRDKSREEKAKELGTEFVTDFRKLIGKVDAVSVVVPTAYHYEVAKPFMEAGTHALIEKPLTLKLNEADELISIAKQKKLVMQVGHIERHNAGLQKIEKVARNIRFLEIHRLSAFTDRVKDCGVVLDMMIHDIDIVMQLVKSEIIYMDSVGINVLTPHEDIANVRIRFKNGAVADLTASRLTPDKQRKIRIFQEDAYISLDYQAQTAQIFKKGILGITSEKLDIQKGEPLKAELESFAQTVLSGKTDNKVDVQARDALEIALQIVEDIKTNHAKALHG